MFNLFYLKALRDSSFYFGRAFMFFIAPVLPCPRANRPKIFKHLTKKIKPRTATYGASILTLKMRADII